MAPTSQTTTAVDAEQNSSNNDREIDSCCSTVKAHLTEKESIERLSFLNGWVLTENEGKRTLAKYYKTSGFRQAVEFIQAIEHITRQFNHHPRIHLSAFEVAVFWRTEIVDGLTDLDFASAEASDAVFEEAISGHEASSHQR